MRFLLDILIFLFLFSVSQAALARDDIYKNQENIDLSFPVSEPVDELNIPEEKIITNKPASKENLQENLSDDLSENSPELSSGNSSLNLPLELNIAVLRGLKKVSAETSSFTAEIDHPVSFGNLEITVKKCHKSRPEDRPEDAVLMLIKDKNPPEKIVFSGWMFSSSPAISALEHPVYDVTLLECKNEQ